MCLNPVGMPPIQRRSFNCPGDGFPEGVAQHGAAGFADGRQRLGSPSRCSRRLPPELRAGFI